MRGYFGDAQDELKAQVLSNVKDAIAAFKQAWVKRAEMRSKLDVAFFRMKSFSNEIDRIANQAQLDAEAKGGRVWEFLKNWAGFNSRGWSLGVVGPTAAHPDPMSDWYLSIHSGGYSDMLPYYPFASALRNKSVDFSGMTKRVSSPEAVTAELDGYFNKLAPSTQENFAPFWNLYKESALTLRPILLDYYKRVWDFLEQFYSDLRVWASLNANVNGAAARNLDDALTQARAVIPTLPDRAEIERRFASDLDPITGEPNKKAPDVVAVQAPVVEIKAVESKKSSKVPLLIGAGLAALTLMGGSK